MGGAGSNAQPHVSCAHHGKSSVELRPPALSHLPCSEKDDMSSDSGHQNPSIVFDESLLTTSLLYTADSPDSPWMQPTARGWQSHSPAVAAVFALR
jgi:hypothetical protein